jgi:hypothetical protein
MTGDKADPLSATHPAAEAADATGAPPAGGATVAVGDGGASDTAETGTAGTDATDATGKRRGAPWTGRRKVADPKTRIVPIRFTPEQYEQLSEKANRAGVAIGTAARTILLGTAGPRAVKRPPVERAELARLLGAIGKIGSNVNQIARAFNEGRDAPSLAELAATRADIALMRAAVMAALGRGRAHDEGEGTES